MDSSDSSYGEASDLVDEGVETARPAAGTTLNVNSNSSTVFIDRRVAADRRRSSSIIAAASPQSSSSSSETYLESNAPPPPRPDLTQAAHSAESAVGPNPPDMGAVYILLGCLAVSGLVVLGILIYCTAHCWRKRCFKTRRSVPTIKISSTNEDGYVVLKQMGMNGQPKVVVTTIDDQAVTTTTPISSSTRQQTTTWTDAIRGGSAEGAATGVIVGRLATGYQNSDIETHKFEHMEQYQSLLDNGNVTSSTVGGGRHHSSVDSCGGGGGGETNGRVILNSGGDSLMDEIERRSVLHYDIGYEKNHTGCFRGTLTFALRYDYIHRVLMVHLIRANHLIGKDRSPSLMNPYVKLYLLPERYHCKTKIYRKTLDPEFNEMFSFDAPYNSLSSRMLQFTMYDFDRFKRHGLIGNVIMRDLFEKSDLYTWTEYTMHIIGSNEKDDYGDLLLYLSYDSDDAKLIVSVAKAYNLRPMDITGASDPYVKMIQLQGHKRVKTRRTTMKRANLHPVYNETLSFDLPPAQIDNTNILIKVMDWDRIGSDDLLGSCVLGNESPTAEGREHWRQCFLRSKQKPIGMWHSLLAEVPEGFTNITK